MDRIDKLRALIKMRFDNHQARFAEAISRSPGQVGQWLGGHRKLGDAGARHIEITLGLAQGYFDDARAGHKSVQEIAANYSVQTLSPPAIERALINELLSIAHQMNDGGLHRLIERATVLAEQFALKQKRLSSR